MAVRIAGVVLPEKKHIGIALMRVYGIGRSSSLKILKRVGVSPSLRTDQVGAEETAKIRSIVENEYRTEGELRREVLNNIRRFKEIGCYRGIRHARGLPVRGQRTRTNSRTVRGNVRQTTFSGRRVLSKGKK